MDGRAGCLGLYVNHLKVSEDLPLIVCMPRWTRYYVRRYIVVRHIEEVNF